MAPPNDDFANAQLLVGDSGSVPGTNVGATIQTGEPGPDFRGNSVWYKWVAAHDGRFTATITAHEPPWWFRIGIYEGTAYDSLVTWMSYNQNEWGFPTDAVVYRCVAGTTYYILIGSYNTTAAGTGTFDLSWEWVPNIPPDNDNFANAYELGGLTSELSAGTTIGATTEPGEPLEQNLQTIWYRMRPNVNGTATIYIPYQGFFYGSAEKGVYTGSSVDALTEIAHGFSSTTEVPFRVQQGVTYHICIAPTMRVEGPPYAYPFRYPPSEIGISHTIVNDIQLTSVCPGVGPMLLGDAGDGGGPFTLIPGLVVDF